MNINPNNATDINRFDVAFSGFNAITAPPPNVDGVNCKPRARILVNSSSGNVGLTFMDAATYCEYVLGSSCTSSSGDASQGAYNRNGYLFSVSGTICARAKLFWWNEVKNNDCAAFSDEAFSDIVCINAPTPTPADTTPPQCTGFTVSPDPLTIGIGQALSTTATFTDNVSVSEIVTYVNSDINGETGGIWGKLCDLTGLSDSPATSLCNTWKPPDGGQYAGLGKHALASNAVDSAGNIAQPANGRGCTGSVCITKNPAWVNALDDGLNCLETGIYVSWEPVSEATGYKLYRNEIYCTDATVTHATDDRGAGVCGIVDCDTTYTYQVKAVFPGSCLSTGTTDTGSCSCAPTPTSTPTPPPCPDNLRETKKDLNHDGSCWIQIAWDDVAGEDSYKAYRDGPDTDDAYNTSLGQDATLWKDDPAGLPLLRPGTTYNYNVNPVYPDSGEKTCPSIAITCPAALTCTVILSPLSLTITQGETGPQVAIVTISNESSPDDSVSRIDFSSIPTSVATVNPNQYVFPPPGYSTTVSGVSPGNATITGIVTLNNGNTCPDDTLVTVIPPGPWFQTQEGDVHAVGRISDTIPTSATNKFFSLNGLGGYPGVVSYNSASAPQFGSGSVSQNPPFGWLANTTASRNYYDYFYSVLGSPTLIAPPSDSEIKNGDLPVGDGIMAYNGDIAIGESLDILTRKIVIITSGKFLIKHKISIDFAHGGSLVVVAKGAIGLSKNLSAGSLPNNYLGGIFITDGPFYSSVEPDFNFNPADSDRALLIQGGVIANSFDFGRDLGADNSTDPAENFVYRPELLMNTNSLLWLTPHSWEELAP